MHGEFQKFILRLRMIEILSRYSEVQQQFHRLRQWKERWIYPN